MDTITITGKLVLIVDAFKDKDVICSEVVEFMKGYES